MPQEGGRPVSSKCTEQLLDRVRDQGFVVKLARSGHYRVTGPDGTTVTVPKTPATRRSLRNTRAALRRIGATV